MDGKAKPKASRKPCISEINPSTGGASRNVTKANCARAATFFLGVRSLRRAAEDIARGKITALPEPINRNPIREVK